MQKHSFASFDIDSFYPSITEPLLSKAILFAKNFTTIRDKDIDIIIQCRKSLLFDKETAWTKKNHSDMFDVTMGSFDGAEVCELIGLFLLNNLSEKYGKNNVGLYRDDGLVLLRNANGPQSERTRKDITPEFKKQGLNISINTNLKICNFLDVTLKARANARNIVGQQDATFGPTCCERLHTMLCVGACCCDLLEVVGWTLKLQSQQVPTFPLFRGHRSVFQQCCVRLHSTSNNVAPVHAHYMPRIHTNTCEQEIRMVSEMENVPESFVFSSKDPTCCDLLRAFAHIGPTMLRVVARVCTGLKLRGRNLLSIQKAQ